MLSSFNVSRSCHVGDAAQKRRDALFWGVQKSFWWIHKTKVIFLVIQKSLWVIEIQNVFSRNKSFWLTFSEGKWGLTICLIVLDILESKKRQGWGSTVGDPKSSRKNSRKQQHTKQEKQQKQQKAQTTGNSAQTTGAAQAEASCTNNKEHQTTATQEKNTKRISKRSSKSSKHGKQQHKKATKAVQTFWKVKSGKGVFFTQQQEQGGPNAGREANPEKLRPRGVGPRRVVGKRGGGASSRGNSVGYRQILSQVVEVKGLQSTLKNVIIFWKVKHCKGGRRGRFDGRRVNSSNKHKQQQKQRQQQAATGTQATRKAATSSIVRSSTNSTNNNPEK